MDAAVAGQQSRRRIRPPEPLVMAAAPPTPAAFRCPISLEVMRSPVSLPTGATYDRASIQRWLDSGHRTCPATRLPLASTDLVPNLLLRRLIHLHAATLPPSPSPEQVLSQLAAADGEPAAAEKAVRSLAAKIAPEKGKRASVASAVAADLDSAVPALLSFAKGGAGADARVDAVRILATVAPELVAYLTGDGKEKPGRVSMAVEALAAVLSADGVAEEAKDAVVVTLVAEDLGRIATTLLGAGSNGAAVLEAILTLPAPEAVGKLLVVMQGDCAPTTSRMAGELLRAVRLEQERKGMAASYDSRTIHVMPY